MYKVSKIAFMFSNELHKKSADIDSIDYLIKKAIKIKTNQSNWISKINNITVGFYNLF